MRLHVVPVGASLMNKERIPRARATLNALTSVHDVLTSATRDGALNLTAALSTAREVSATVLDDLARAPATACVEWEALAERGAERVGEDAFVFIATDTDTGLRNATLVAARYAQRDQVTPTYVADPLAPNTTLPPLLQPRRLLIARVPGLDLAKATKDNRLDRNTWISLGEIGHVLAATAAQGGVEVLFHLSGGYKALLPHLLVVAEGVQSALLENNQGDTAVSAYCLHEDSETSVPLPVRWLTPVPLGHARRLMATADPHGTVPRDAFPDFVGTLLQDRGDPPVRELTPAGLILTRTLWALGRP